MNKGLRCVSLAPLGLAILLMLLPAVAALGGAIAAEIPGYRAGAPGLSAQAASFLEGTGAGYLKGQGNQGTFVGRLRATLQGLPHLLIITTFLFFLCLLEGLTLVLFDRGRRQQRLLQKRLKYLDRLEKRFTQESLLKLEHLTGQSWLRRLSRQVRFLEGLQRLLRQADVSWPLGVVLSGGALSGAVNLSLGYYQWGVPGGFLGLAAGLFLPYKLLTWKRRHRLKRFEKQLPEALDLLARGLKAGHAFASGLQMVGEEMADPIGLEFFKTFKEYNHGMDMNRALLNLCQRVELKELRFFTTAVMIQRETGGNLTEILEKIASLIRERFKLRNQIKALTAEGRLSGWILILLPPVIFSVMLKINPDYTLMLVHHGTGRLMALTALFFQLLGMLTIRRIVNIRI